MNQFLIRRIATQEIEYAIKASTVDPDATGPFDPDNPAPTVSPMVEPGCEAIPYEGSLSILGEQPTPTSVLEWHDGLVWVERGDMAAQRAHKVQELNAACQASIYSGFDSDALGEVHRYGCDSQDQANLVASVVDSKLDNPDGWVTAFKCAGPDGVREYKTHTAAQIQKVGKDGKAHITACLLNNEMLISQLA